MVHPDPSTPLRKLLPALFVSANLGAVFIVLAEDVWFKESFTWDAPLILTIHQYRSLWLDDVMASVTQMGEGGAIAIAIGWAVWLVRRRRMLDALTLAVNFGGAITLNTLLKLLFARPRPTLFPPLVIETDFSFPSGHVIAAVALYGLMAVVLWRQRQRGWAILCVALIFLIALSRIYLGVHYPSDVLGSLSLGSLWLVGIIAVRTWIQRSGYVK